MINQSDAWKTLEQHQQNIKQTKLSELLKDKKRFENFSKNAPYWLLDFSRNIANQDTIKLLCDLAETASLNNAIEDLFTGKKINTTEDRQVLHTELRNPDTELTEIQSTLDQMEHFCQQIHNRRWYGVTGEPITDVVCLGIGGSALGPEMVTTALKHYANKNITCHYVSNIAPSDFSMKLKDVNPHNLMIIISSKTFTTSETMTNAKVAKSWLSHMLGGDHCIPYHFAAITADVEKAKAFGIDPDNIFPIWEGVGGRFSLWSAIGLPIALYIGFNKFKQLLAGAHEMDKHFRNTPLNKNLPVLMALLGIWYHNFWNAPTHAVISYSCYMERFIDYLQQVDMESNGKRVNKHGETLPYQTCPVIWGGIGTDSQHSFHQFLHQGTQMCSLDFIAFKESLNPTYNQQAMLYANCIAQIEALAKGQSLEAVNNNPHRVTPGNKPCNLLLTQTLTPESLGALLALYEHKVFTQGVIWNINSFDQYGVELGKTLAADILQQLESNEASSIGAVEWFKA